MKIEDSLLNDVTRARNLAAMSRASETDPLDLLVVGGGVTGLGAALDAAARGLRVGLVEKGDYASGTSGASSRLAHGGLRYLEQGHFRLVREALRERQLLATTIAPHLTRRLDLLFPAHTSLQLPYFRAGVYGYDLLAGIGGGRLDGSASRTIRKPELRRIAPGLNTDDMSGAIQFADAQIDDARHTMVLARTAQGLGAHVVNYAKLQSLLPRQGDCTRAAIEADGHVINTWARSVLLAVGPWANGMSRPMAGRDLVRPSKGTHIVVRRSAIQLEHAVLARTRRSVLFVLPWNSSWIIGTTDHDYRGALDEVQADEEDVSYLLDQANRILSSPLGRDDVTATYAGLRPLPVSTGVSRSTRVSREHVIEELAPGVFSIFGGKYTTYRVMAKDAVDSICSTLGRSNLTCRTDRLPLAGAPGSFADGSGPGSLAVTPGAGAMEHLRRRYGSEAASVFASAQDSPVAFDPIIEGSHLLRIDVEQAYTREGARTVDDVLARRLRITTENAADAAKAHPVVTQIAQAIRSRSTRDAAPTGRSAG